MFGKTKQNGSGASKRTGKTSTRSNVEAAKSTSKNSSARKTRMEAAKSTSTKSANSARRTTKACK